MSHRFLLCMSHFVVSWMLFGLVLGCVSCVRLILESV
jgi:hypothetical protein